MFAGLRRFQRIIWVIAAIVVIPTFVVFFSPSALRSRRDNAGGDLGSIDGKKITTAEFLDARREAMFRMFMTTRRWPENEGERLNDFTYYQLLIISQIKEHNIHVSQSAVSHLALSFGITDVNAFMQNVVGKHSGVQVTKDDFVRFLEHEAAFRELTQLAAVSGQLILPRNAEAKFQKQYQENVVEAVFFSAKDYTNGVTFTQADLQKYYTNNQSLYRLQERLQISYVEFPKSNYFAQADAALSLRTNLAALIDQEYQRRGATNFTDPKNPSVTLPEKEAKDQLKEMVRGESALISAYNAAAELSDKLMNQGNGSAAAFEQFMTANKQTVQLSSPFDRNTVPPELKGVSSEILPHLFELTNQASVVYFTPIRGENSIYLVAAKQRIPSQMEPFETVRAKVAADYIKSQSRTMLAAAGNSFVSVLTNQLAAGKSFAEIASSSKLRVEAIPPFSAATENLPELSSRMDLSRLKFETGRLTNGAVSRFIFTADGGAVLHLRERKSIAEDARKEKFEAFVQEERMNHLNESFGKWISKVEQAKLQRPVSASEENKGAAAQRQ